MASVTDCTPVRCRRKGPTPQQWSQIRTRFTNLYLQERPRLSLAQIKDLVAQDDRFHAELHSYKLKIRQWGLCRNIKKAEAIRLACSYESSLTVGALSPPPELHQHFVKAAKVERHTRRRTNTAMRTTVIEKALAKAGPKGRIESPMSLLNRVQHRGTYGYALRIPAFTFPHNEAEYALHAIRNWHHWYLCYQDLMSAEQLVQANGSKCHFPDHWFWLGSMQKGITAMHAGYRVNAIDNFTRGCDEFWSTLCNQPCTFMVELVRLFCFSPWKSCADFKVRILKHFYQLALSRLERRHPVVQVLQALQGCNATTLPEWRKAARYLLYDVVDQPESFWVKQPRFSDTYSRLWSIKDHSDSSDKAESVQYLAAMLAKAASVLGPRHETTLGTKADLARALVTVGDHETARAASMEILGLSPGIHDGREIAQLIEVSTTESLVGYRALDIMAQIHSEQAVDDVERSVLWTGLCFEWTIRRELDQINMLNALQRLQDALIKSDRWAELTQLREEHSELNQLMPDRLRLYGVAGCDSSFPGLCEH